MMCASCRRPPRLQAWWKCIEVVSDGGGSKTMRPEEGGLTIAAGGTHELVPGGDHPMLMDLKAPPQPGADVPVSLMLDDGSSLPVTAQVRISPAVTRTISPHPPRGHG